MQGTGLGVGGRLNETKGWRLQRSLQHGGCQFLQFLPIVPEEAKACVKSASSRVLLAAISCTEFEKRNAFASDVSFSLPKYLSNLEIQSAHESTEKWGPTSRNLTTHRFPRLHVQPTSSHLCFNSSPLSSPHTHPLFSLKTSLTQQVAETLVARKRNHVSCIYGGRQGAHVFALVHPRASVGLQTSENANMSNSNGAGEERQKKWFGLVINKENTENWVGATGPGS